jgi:SpoIIAA-like
MITAITGLPSYVAGFTASGTVTKENYSDTVLPRLKEVIREHGHIHFLLVLETDVSNFTAGAWMSDALAGLQHLFKWKKMAIVTDQAGVEKFTDFISPIMPGESKGFALPQLDEAKAWVVTED